MAIAVVILNRLVFIAQVEQVQSMMRVLFILLCASDMHRRNINQGLDIRLKAGYIQLATRASTHRLEEERRLAHAHIPGLPIGTIHIFHHPKRESHRTRPYP